MKASNPKITEETERQMIALRSLGAYHTIEVPGYGVVPGLQTLEQLQQRLARFPISDDLAGKRVLDIGAWDGWFSFEMEKRGATVVAVDVVPSRRFSMAREMLGSRVEHRIADVFDLRPEDVGYFDIVLFLGVLYHLKHPLLALERVCALSTDLVCVESYVTDADANADEPPRLEFYEGAELCGQFDNWVGPNIACLLAMCRAAGFAKVSLCSVNDNRAHVSCFRKFERKVGVGPAPRIVCVENATSRDQVFSVLRDDYISLWFKAAHAELTSDDVLPEVGDYGVRPACVRNVGKDGWQAVFKLPPGLRTGWSPVRIRVRDSAYSNTVRIGLDVTEEERRKRMSACAGMSKFTIEIVADGKTWERNQVRMRQDACISLWVRGLPRPCGVDEVFVRLAGFELPAVFVSDEDDLEGLTQVNAMIPSGLSPGGIKVNVAAHGMVTPPAPLEVIAE